MTVNFPLKPLFDRDLLSIKNFPVGVIVFDRDGTLVEDAGQHNDILRLVFLPGALDTIKLVAKLGYGIAIATNQSGLESEKFSLKDMNEFNEVLKMRVRKELTVDISLVISCPHLASTNCYCRKPKTGLLESIETSGLGAVKVFLGDKESDRICAENFGVDFIDVDHRNISVEFKKWLAHNDSC